MLISKYKISTNQIFKNINSFSIRDNSNYVGIIATTADNRLNIVKKLSYFKIKYIFCEKPIAQSIDEALKIKNFCKKNKIKISINHSRRFSEEIKMISKIIKNQKMGNLISINLNGANVGVAMVTIHFIEIFLFMTKSRITNVFGKLEKNKLKNPRGNKFKDYNGYILAENDRKQSIIINTHENACHGCMITYTCEKGIIVHDVIGEKILINVRKKFLNQPSFKYALPNSSKILSFKKY